MATKSSPGGTPATVALTRAGVAFTTHSYEHDPAATSFGLEAAEVLGLPPEQVFKTLLADVDGALVVAIVPVTGKLDLKALAAAVGGKKAAMADPHVAERTTGYVVGGISPLGQRKAAAHRPRRDRSRLRHRLRQRRQTRLRPRSDPSRPRGADQRNHGTDRPRLTSTTPNSLR